MYIVCCTIYLVFGNGTRQPWDNPSNDQMNLEHKKNKKKNKLAMDIEDTVQWTAVIPTVTLYTQQPHIPQPPTENSHTTTHFPLNQLSSQPNRASIACILNLHMARARFCVKVYIRRDRARWIQQFAYYAWVCLCNSEYCVG